LDNLLQPVLDLKGIELRRRTLNSWLS